MTTKHLLIKPTPTTAKRRDRKASKFNAVQTGVYATGRLPYESEERYNKHHAEFRKSYRPIGYLECCLVRHMAGIMWQFQRTELMTAAAMHRHEFGRELLEAGAQSWQEANRSTSENLAKTFNGIPGALSRAIKMAAELQQASGADDVSEAVEKLSDACIKAAEALQGIEAKLDLQRDFYDKYMPQKFDQIVRVQNALLAQFDRVHSRLQIVQEGRLKREQLRQAAEVDAVLNAGHGKPAAAADAVRQADTGQRLADGGDRPWRSPSHEIDKGADDDISEADRIFDEYVNQQGD